LKKSGEEDWRKRVAPPVPTSSSTLNDEQQQQNNYNTKPVHNIVKMQQEQIKQQLQNITPKQNNKLLHNPTTSSGLNSHFIALGNSNNNPKRNVLTPNTNEINKLSSGASQKPDSTIDIDSDSSSSSDNNQRKMPQPGSISKKIAVFNETLKNPIIPLVPKSSNDSGSNRAGRRINSAGSDTDSMLAHNARVLNTTNSINQAPSQSLIKKPTQNNDTVELFSTDSEMDSFFKENELIVNNNDGMISGVSSNSNSPKQQSSEQESSQTMNEDLDDDEFDRIVSEAQRLTQGVRAKPSRKTKSKGNHLKNLQQRIEIKNDYQQQQQQNTSQPAANSELINNLMSHKKFNKSSVS
jgi:hypothetical protein